MRLQFAIASQSAAVDRFTNRLSLFNILEAIQSPRFPVFLPEAVVVFVLRREASDIEPFDAEITLTLGGNRIGQSRMRVTIGDSPHVRLIANFQNLPILAVGDLEFTIQLPNVEPIRTSIPVIQTPVVQVPIVPVQAAPR